MDAPAVDELTNAPALEQGVEGTAVAVPTVEAIGSESSAPSLHLEGAWRTAAACGLIAAVAAGLVLRFWTRSPLWLDEALTVDIAKLPLHKIPAALKRDGAPPLYYVLLHVWMKIFGSSDFAVRSLSGVLSVATLPVAWVAARRFGGRTVAWFALVVLATAPFAVYYSTEARMYALVMFLTACGFVAVDRALEKPRVGNLVAVAVVAGALLYSQYWSLYLLGALALWLLWMSIGGARSNRINARFTLGALAVGCLTFVPWVPTFLFQSHHTGTPWAKPANFTAVINAVTGYTDNQARTTAGGSDQGRLLAICYFVLAALALFGLARDRWHIDIDLRTRRPARGLSFVVAVTLFAAVAGGILTGSAFSTRYAAVVFIPLLLLVSYGALTLADAKVRTAILVVAAVAGLIGSAENISTSRTQAAQVADVINTQAKPGDIVAFCPDQLGPAVYREVDQPAQYKMVTFPRRTGPQFINWVDYGKAVHAANPEAFVQSLVAQAGSTHRIWLTWMPGYQSFGTKCEQIATALLQTPGYGGHNWVTSHPAKNYEPMNLTEFAPTSG